MNAVQKFLMSITSSMGTAERSAAQEVAVVGSTRVIRRPPSMVDRIVFFDDTDPFDVGICKVKLNAMFTSSFFSICEVTECVKLLKVSTTFTGRTLERLRSLHCMNWNKMPKELIDCIPEMISEIFTEGAYPETTTRQVVSDQ